MNDRKEKNILEAEFKTIEDNDKSLTRYQDNQKYNSNENNDYSSNQEERAYKKYENIDWKRVSQEKVFAVMAEIMLENKRIYQECDRLNREIEQNYSSKKTQDNSKVILEEIAQKIAPLLAKRINSGEDISAVEMKECINYEVLQEKSRLIKKVQELTERVKSYKELNDEFQAQYYDLVEQMNKLKEENNKKPVDAKANTTEEEQKTYTIDELNKDIMANLPEEKPVREQKAIMKIIPIEKARELFNTEECLAIAKVLGSEGISEFPLIQKKVRQDGISESRFETLITNMEKENIVEVIKVTTFQRNTGLRLIKLKEEVGYMLYKEAFGKNPVEPEMEIIRKENDNYEHGYSIKDTLNVLKENYGFEEISMSRKENTISISKDNMKTWIPDIIGINPVTTKKEYFEVELGNHNEENFNYKLDKALYVTSELKIITSNKIQADRILGKVKAWYNQKKTYPNILIRVYTFVEFKRKENGKFYPEKIENKDKLLEETVSKNTENKTDKQNNQTVDNKNNNNKENNKKNKPFNHQNQKNIQKEDNKKQEEQPKKPTKEVKNIEEEI